MTDSVTIYSVVSDVPGWDKHHYYCVYYFPDLAWALKNIPLYIPSTSGKKEMFLRNVKWLRNKTTYWTGSMAIMEGEGWSWSTGGQKMTPGTGRIINIWNGMDADNVQEMNSNIEEMNVRMTASDSSLTLTIKAYMDGDGDNINSLLSFDLYTRYLA